MSGLIPIGIPEKVLNDPRYRYVMPPIQPKTEGTGNGKRTCITNLDAVADALSRPPPVILQYLAIALATKSRWHGPKGNQRPMLNGHYTQGELQEVLQEFIQDYVLCKQCHYPEADMYVKPPVKKGKGEIKYKCTACGHKSFADMKHRICAFIVSHERTIKKSDRQKSSKVKPRREKNAMLAERDNRTGVRSSLTPLPSKTISSNSSSDSESVPPSNGRSALVSASTISNVSSLSATSTSEQSESDNDSSGSDWDIDASEDAQAHRKAALSTAALKMSGDFNRSLRKSLKVLCFDDSQPPQLKSPQNCSEAILKFKKDHSLSNREVLTLIFEVILVDTSLVRQLSPSRFGSILHQLAGSDPVSQLHLLYCIEKVFAGVSNSKLFNIAFQALYQAEFIAEDVFYQWESIPPPTEVSNDLNNVSVSEDDSARLRAEAAPFLVWLRTAEEDDSEEETSEEESSEDED